MHLTTFVGADEVFVNCECVPGFSYKIGSLWDNYALFAPKTAQFGSWRDKSVRSDTRANLSPERYAA